MSEMSEISVDFTLTASHPYFPDMIHQQSWNSCVKFKLRIVSTSMFISMPISQSNLKAALMPCGSPSGSSRASMSSVKLGWLHHIMTLEGGAIHIPVHELKSTRFQLSHSKMVHRRLTALHFNISLEAVSGENVTILNHQHIPLGLSD